MNPLMEIVAWMWGSKRNDYMMQMPHCKVGKVGARFTQIWGQDFQLLSVHTLIVI
jgi:hypothetical protein